MALPSLSANHCPTQLQGQVSTRIYTLCNVCVVLFFLFCFFLLASPLLISSSHSGFAEMSLKNLFESLFSLLNEHKYQPNIALFSMLKVSHN